MSLLAADRRDNSMLGGTAAAILWSRVALAIPILSDANTQLADVVSDLVIPATTIPGARAAGVPAFVLIGIVHQTLGANGDEPLWRMAPATGCWPSAAQAGA